MTIETLKGLTALGNATPLPASVRSYIQDNIALGSGSGGSNTVFDSRNPPGDSQVAAKSDPRWSDFMNAYAVWEPDVVLGSVSLGTLQAQSSNFNFTQDPANSYIKKNGLSIGHLFTRGHTVAIFDSTALNLESVTTYDTWDQGSDILLAALTAIPDGRVVAIASFDATNFNAATRAYANSVFGTTRTATWVGRTAKQRIAHVIIAQKNGTLVPYEAIHSGASEMPLMPDRSISIPPVPGIQSAAANFNRSYTLEFPISTNYIFTWQVDNSAQVFLDDVEVGSSGSNFDGPSEVVSFFVTAGTHTLSFTCQNAGDVAGFALTVTGGNCGTYRITDFLGTAAGIPMNRYVSQANELIANSVSAGQTTMLTLLECYSEMRQVVDGSPPFDITVGGSTLPGSPFADYDSALAALVTRANQQVGAILAAIPEASESAVGWTAMAKHFANEAIFQGKAGIDWATIPGDLELPVTVFVTALAGYGQDTKEGGAAQFLESVANVDVQAGQAIIAAMREGRNNETLDAESVKHDNVIPEAPIAPPPRATLSNSQYTVTEARALAGG